MGVSWGLGWGSFSRVAWEDVFRCFEEEDKGAAA